MTIDPRQLLRRLEPAVRPAGESSVQPRLSAADGDFLELLSLAKSGGVESGREAVVADGSTLEPSTLAQVGRALDLAQSRGAPPRGGRGRTPHQHRRCSEPNP